MHHRKDKKRLPSAAVLAYHVIVPQEEIPPLLEKTVLAVSPITLGDEGANDGGGLG